MNINNEETRKKLRTTNNRMMFYLFLFLNISLEIILIILIVKCLQGSIGDIHRKFKELYQVNNNFKNDEMMGSIYLIDSPNCSIKKNECKQLFVLYDKYQGLLKLIFQYYATIGSLDVLSIKNQNLLKLIRQRKQHTSELREINYYNNKDEYCDKIQSYLKENLDILKKKKFLNEINNVTILGSTVSFGIPLSLFMFNFIALFISNLLFYILKMN